MNFKTLAPDKSVSLFVKNILVFERTDPELKTVLPFYADGYPGLLFQETTKGLIVEPHNKIMPEMFLYGQTLKPIELVMTGPYKLIIYQVYPFVLKSLFNLSHKDLNDNCYDLNQLDSSRGIDVLKSIKQTSSLDKRIKIISRLLITLFNNKKEELDIPIASAIQMIIHNKGQVTISDLYTKLHLTERTFERRFFNSAGVTAKQFSKIIQFQHSLEQLKLKDYTKLTDIVYANGFADQSHFIKVFKAFTGKTPFAFTSKK
ncbi:MAG: AraC family transcriptional regulator [Bacteroidota bacterium]